MTHPLETYGRLLRPEEAEEPILAKPVRAALMEWLTEIWAAEDLIEVGLKPRRRALFTGKPGTGKTTLAHHLAARLGIAVLVVRPEKIQTKYVGGSAELVGRLFDAVMREDEPVFLFFDEFDSAAAKRMSGESGSAVGVQDHNHTINTLLACLDNYEGFCVAATNYGDRIDEAVWRRFELQIDIALPQQFERERILERYLAPFVLPDDSLALLAESFETATPALMRSFAEYLKRQTVIGPKAGWDMGREAVLSRILATVKPHPDAGLPRFWSLGLADRAAKAFPWPLCRDKAEYEQSEPAAADNVAQFRPRGAA